MLVYLTKAVGIWSPSIERRNTGKYTNEKRHQHVARSEKKWYYNAAHSGT